MPEEVEHHLLLTCRACEYENPLARTNYSELRSCVKVEVPSWAPVPNKPTVSVDVKQHSTNQQLIEDFFFLKKKSVENVYLYILHWAPFSLF